MYATKGATTQKHHQGAMLTMEHLHLGALFLGNGRCAEAATRWQVALGEAGPHYGRSDGHAALFGPRLA